MLVLSRGKEESILLSDRNGLNIEIKVVDVRGDKVRIGITAPLSISVLRDDARRVVPTTAKAKERTGL